MFTQHGTRVMQYCCIWREIIMQWNHHFAALEQSGLRAVGEQLLCKVFLYHSAGNVILKERGHLWYLVCITCRQIFTNPLKLLEMHQLCIWSIIQDILGLKKNQPTKQHTTLGKPVLVQQVCPSLANQLGCLRAWIHSGSIAWTSDQESLTSQSHFYSQQSD